VELVRGGYGGGREKKGVFFKPIMLIKFIGLELIVIVINVNFVDG
jgi:hypothetical protein